MTHIKAHITILFTLILLTIASLPARAATLTVTDCSAVSGAAGRLSEQITAANSGDTIDFSCSGTIPFGGTFFTISKDLTIDGGGVVAFDNALSNRFFSITGGFTLTLNNLTLQNGRVSLYGGAIFNDGTVNLNNATLTGNISAYGAVDNNGTVNVNNSTFSGNNAGIYNYNVGATTTVTNSTFINNTSYAINNYNGTVSSQGTTYTNNACSGSPIVTDLGGNMKDALSIGCPGVILAALSASAICNGANLDVNITAGDANFDITGDATLLSGGVGTGLTSITGPITVTTLTVTELGGDGEVATFGPFNCTAPTTPLSASAVCIGADLQVTISAGDANFNITADSGTLSAGVGTGVYLYTGPRNEADVFVSELGGNLESINLGNFNCFASSTLSATAVCNGADLEITITNGNAPFTVNVTPSAGVLSMGGVALGTYTFTGPDTFANISVVEEAGDLETLPLTSVTCTAPIVPVVPVVPVAPVVLSPDLTAQGCVFTTNIEAPNAPDNTYCRVLMNNGAVVNYAGAIPADLIGLGVKLAVDVYRLEGGATVNIFPAYQQICLAGEGRFFYMDGRNAPRYSVEMASESVDGMTCAWIPAPGTVILTN